MIVRNGQHLLGMLAVMACLTSNAHGQFAAKAGKVYVANTSGENIVLACVSYIDENGVRQTIKGGAWTIKPDARGHLTDQGTSFTASRFDFTIQTTSGKTDWHVNTLDADGDLTINFDRNLLARHNARLVPPLRLAGAGGGGAGPTPREVEAAVGKIIGAAVAQAIASQEPENVFQALLIEAARRVRDELVEGALKDVFSDRPLHEIQAARRVISLGLDGKLSVDALNREQAREALLGRLKAIDPDIGAGAQIADFIYTVLQARKR
ncbi:MAG: hypothetical protein EBV06_09330 [Planctomycetia bacterium]|nr:hypothetical protein [Planctomycetia bacterium]